MVLFDKGLLVSYKDGSLLEAEYRGGVPNGYGQLKEG